MTAPTTPKPADVPTRSPQPVNQAEFTPVVPGIIVPDKLPRTPGPLFRLAFGYFIDVIQRLAHIGKSIGDMGGVISLLASEVKGLRERIPTPKSNTFGEAVTIYEWKIVPGTNEGSLSMYATREELVEPGPGLIQDIVQRVDTITAMGDLCSMTFDRRNGKLGIHARKRLS